MYTSTFGRAGRRETAVSIARSAPDWFNGQIAHDLAPPLDILRDYQRTRNAQAYTRAYQARVLDRLEPAEVVDRYGRDAILLCWCAPGSFCHRRLVAEWIFDGTGLVVEEIIPQSRRPSARPIAPGQVCLPL